MTPGNQDPRDVASDALLALLPVSLNSQIAAAGTVQACVNCCSAALLLVDVSGFSTVALQLEQCTDEGAEALTDGLNAYFTRLLQIVRDYGGDVILFSGDAVLAAWFAPLPDVPEQAPAVSVESADLAAALALRCADRILQDAAKHEFSVDGGAEAVHCRLGVHCGAAHGAVGRMIVGGHGQSSAGLWKYMVTGRAVELAGAAANLAKEAELVCTAALYEAARREGAAATTSVVDGEATGGPYCRLLALDSQSAPPPSPLLLASSARPAQGAAQLFVFDSAIASAQRGQMRTVSVVFIKLTALDCSQDADGLHRDLHAAVKTVQKTLKSQDGVLNKVVMDDKGVILLCLFGLPLHVHEDDAERAVQLGVKASKRLSPVVGATSIGIARAKVYCGLTGAPWRNEYTVLGDGVNIAARLMIKAETFSHGKRRHVICDDDTARSCQGPRLGLAFVGSGVVVLKGRQEPVVCHHVVPESEREHFEGRGSVGSIESASGLSSHGSFASSFASNSTGLSSPRSSAHLGRLSRAHQNRLSKSPSVASSICGSPRAAISPNRGQRSPQPQQHKLAPADSDADDLIYLDAALQEEDELTARDTPLRASHGNRLSLSGSEGRAAVGGSVKTEALKLPINQASKRMFSTPRSSKISPRSPRTGAGGIKVGRVPTRDRNSGSGSSPRSACSQGRGDGHQMNRAGHVASTNSLCRLESVGSGSAELQPVARKTPQEGDGFHGREDVMARINLFLSDSANAGKSFAIIGDLQQGKTATVRRAGESAARKGFTSVYLYPSEASHRDPFGSLGAALQRHASATLKSSSPLEALRSMFSGDDEMLQSLPLLHHVLRVPELPLPGPPVALLPPREKALRVAKLCAVLLGSATPRDGPLALLIDDVQWLDSSSAAAVGAMLEQQWLPGTRAVVAARHSGPAGEPPELPPPPAAEVLEASMRLRSQSWSSHGSHSLIVDDQLVAEGTGTDWRQVFLGGESCELHGLGPQAHRELLADILRCASVSRDLEELLRLKGEGAPGLTHQMAAALRDAGVVQATANGVATVELTQEVDEALVHAVPAIEAAVMRQVDTLDDEQRRVLSAAAVLAVHNCFGGEAVALCTLPEDERKGLLTRDPGRSVCAAPPGVGKIISVLGDLCKRGLLRPLTRKDVPVGKWRSAQHGFRFARPLARDVVYQSVLAKDRRRLHHAALDALASVGGPDAGPEALQYHHRRANRDLVDNAELIDLLRVAARAAVRRGEATAALDLLSVLRDLGGEEDSAAAALHAGLCHYEVGALGLAVHYCQRAFGKGDGAALEAADTGGTGSCWCCFGRRQPQLRYLAPADSGGGEWANRLQALALRAELSLWTCDAGALRMAADLAAQEAERGGQGHVVNGLSAGARAVLGRPPTAQQRQQPQGPAAPTSVLELMGNCALDVHDAAACFASGWGMHGLAYDFNPLRLPEQPRPGSVRRPPPRLRPAAEHCTGALHCATALLLGMAHDARSAAKDLGEMAEGDGRWRAYARLFNILARRIYPLGEDGGAAAAAAADPATPPECADDNVLRGLASATGARSGADAAAAFDQLRSAGVWELHTPLHSVALFALCDAMRGGRRRSKPAPEGGQKQLHQAVNLLARHATIFPVVRVAAAFAAALAAPDSAARLQAFCRVVAVSVAEEVPYCGLSWRARAHIVSAQDPAPDQLRAAIQGVDVQFGRPRDTDVAVLLLESAAEAQCADTLLAAYLKRQFPQAVGAVARSPRANGAPSGPPQLLACSAIKMGDVDDDD